MKSNYINRFYVGLLMLLFVGQTLTAQTSPLQPGDEYGGGVVVHYDPFWGKVLVLYDGDTECAWYIYSGGKYPAREWAASLDKGEYDVSWHLANIDEMEKLAEVLDVVDKKLNVPIVKSPGPASYQGYYGTYDPAIPDRAPSSSDLVWSFFFGQVITSAYQSWHKPAVMKHRAVRTLDYIITDPASLVITEENGAFNAIVFGTTDGNGAVKKDVKTVGDGSFSYVATSDKTGTLKDIEASNFTDYNGHNYNLASGSFLLETADPTKVLDNGYLKDLNGSNRLVVDGLNKTVSYGAYEYTLSDPSIQFVGTAPSICPDVTNTTLQVSYTGGGTAWSFKYRTDKMTIGDPDIEVTSTTIGSSNPYTLTIANPQSTTVYSLVSVTDETNSIVKPVTGVTTTITVYPLVNAGTISSSNGTTITVSEQTTLTTNGVTQGIWTSSDPTIASIDDSTGDIIVTGVKKGAVTITYDVTDNSTNCTGESSITLQIQDSYNPPGPGPIPVPDPDPDPTPEPEPNPDPAISVKDIAPFCYSDYKFRIPFDLLYTKGIVEYSIVFSEDAKSAGFEDMAEYVPLSGNYIEVPVTAVIPKGIYTGTIQLQFEGEANLVRSYPFSLEVLESVEIIEQPLSVTGYCGENGIVLSVKAVGDNLSYQWYHNDKKIEGATWSTYDSTLTTETEGLYYVVVTGDCGEEISDKVTVSTSNLLVSVKWDDVLYITNTDNRYVRFQWYKDGQAITNQGNAVYYTDPSGLKGAYSVRAYYSDGTYDESCSIYYEVTTRSSSVSVYPNPVVRNNYLTVESDEVGESYEGGILHLYDLSGRQIYTSRIKTALIQIPMNYPAGNYVLQIIHPSGKFTTKRIIIK